MLSDDDIQRVAIQCDMKIGQHWNKGRMNTLRMRAFARAVEREVRQQALEDAAQACVAIERRKWLAIRDGGVIDSGPLACYSAIQAIKERQC